jgi:DNA-binding XRE family transcriptional regulator
MFVLSFIYIDFKEKLINMLTMSDIANIFEKIGAEIRTRRKRLGMTQLDVAEMTGLQRQTISRVESGNSSVTIASVERIATVVGLDLMVVPKYNDGRS